MKVRLQISDENGAPKPGTLLEWLADEYEHTTSERKKEVRYLFRKAFQSSPDHLNDEQIKDIMKSNPMTWGWGNTDNVVVLDIPDRRSWSVEIVVPPGEDFDVEGFVMGLEDWINEHGEGFVNLY